MREDHAILGAMRKRDALIGTREDDAVIAGGGATVVAGPDGVDEVELVGDSELIVKQVKGEYKVKDATMRELHTEVKGALRDFDRWSIRHVRREHNTEADRLVNEALDG